ncbi:cral trio domain-containing protein, partial [Phakopsora pachyrhizi]
MDRTSFRPNADDQDDDWSKSSSPLSESERCFCSRECLLRILTATRFDLEKSITRLEQTLIWRRQYGVDQIELEIVSKESETGKQFVLGYDRQSRPCLYMFPQRQNTKPSADQIKLVVWSLERTIDLMPPGVENLSLIIDFGSNHSASTTTVYQAKEVIKILQTYYCERLGKAICINVPWVFWGFYKLVKPFLDSRTAEKIEFDPVLTDLVPAEQLPKEPFGGDLDFEYDHGSYFSLLVKLTDQRRKDILERYQRFGENKIGVSEALLRGREPEVETRP